jgi:hypothetical protein
MNLEKFYTGRMIGLIGVLVLVGVFYGGVSYGKSKNSIALRSNGQNNFGQMMGGTGRVVNRNIMGFSGLISGEILSMDKESITLKQRDGGSKIVFYTNKTSVTKTVDGTMADLVVGKQISVVGKSNTDGSVSAESLQIRPNTTETVVK